MNLVCNGNERLLDTLISWWSICRGILSYIFAVCWYYQTFKRILKIVTVNSGIKICDILAIDPMTQSMIRGERKKLKSFEKRNCTEIPDIFAPNQSKVKCLMTFSELSVKGHLFTLNCDKTCNTVKPFGEQYNISSKQNKKSIKPNQI